MRLYFAGRGSSTTHGPTKTHRLEYEIAAERYREIRAELERITGEEMQKLFAQLEKAGVPWTSGRPIPSIRP